MYVSAYKISLKEKNYRIIGQISDYQGLRVGGSRREVGLVIKRERKGSWQ